MTLRTRFDGQSIVLPRELVGHGPCDVEIVLSDEKPQENRCAKTIWEVVAKADGQRNNAEILREISAQRDEWDRG